LSTFNHIATLKYSDYIQRLTFSRVVIFSPNQGLCNCHVSRTVERVNQFWPNLVQTCIWAMQRPS